MVSHLEIVVPANLDEIPKISEDIEEILSSQHFSADEMLDVQLAVEEVIANVINHGYAGKTGSVGIRCDASPEKITIEISDSARAFNPLTVPEPDVSKDIEDRRIGGLGIFLVRRVMDSVTYQYRNHKNVLTLVKIRKNP